MKYYSKEFRLFLTGLLTGYRKMLEQSLASSTDSNYHLLANDTKKQIDEAIKIAKPTAFNSTDKSFQKLQEDTEEYLRQMEKDYQKKEEDLKKGIEEQVKARAEIAKKEQEEEIRSNVAKQFEQERRTMISVELLPKILQEFCAANNYVSTDTPPVVPAANAVNATTAEQKTQEAPTDEEDDGFGNLPDSESME